MLFVRHSGTRRIQFLSKSWQSLADQENLCGFVRPDGLLPYITYSYLFVHYLLHPQSEDVPSTLVPYHLFQNFILLINFINFNANWKSLTHRWYSEFIIIIIIIIIIIVIIIIVVSFMQGIHTHMPETNHVPRGYIVAAILFLLFMVPLSLFPALALLLFYVSTFRSMCAVPNYSSCRSNYYWYHPRFYIPHALYFYCEVFIF